MRSEQEAFGVFGALCLCAAAAILAGHSAAAALVLAGAALWGKAREFRLWRSAGYAALWAGFWSGWLPAGSGLAGLALSFFAAGLGLAGIILAGRSISEKRRLDFSEKQKKRLGPDGWSAVVRHWDPEDLGAGGGWARRGDPDLGVWTGQDAALWPESEPWPDGRPALAALAAARDFQAGLALARGGQRLGQTDFETACVACAGLGGEQERDLAANMLAAAAPPGASEILRRLLDQACGMAEKSLECGLEQAYARWSSRAEFYVLAGAGAPLGSYPGLSARSPLLESAMLACEAPQSASLAMGRRASL